MPDINLNFSVGVSIIQQAPRTKSTLNNFQNILLSESGLIQTLITSFDVELLRMIGGAELLEYFI